MTKKKDWSDFEQFKADITERGKANAACSDQFKRVLSATNHAELLLVIKENISWCVGNKLFTSAELLPIGDQILFENGFITTQITVETGFYVAFNNSTVEARGNSTVKAWDNSTVEAWDNSTVEAWDNSTVKAWDNSTVEAWGNSTVEAWDNSTVKARGNSTVKARGNSTVEARGNSTVEAWDNSTVKARGNSTVKAWDNSYTLFFNSKVPAISDKAVAKDYYKSIIYCKKSSHEIIYID